MPAGDSGEDVTLGEVARNLLRLAEQMDKGFSRVDDQFRTLNMVHQDVYLSDRTTDAERHKATVARIAANEQAVADLKESAQWVWRTLIGALIVAAVAIIVAASGFPH